MDQAARTRPRLLIPINDEKNVGKLRLAPQPINQTATFDVLRGRRPRLIRRSFL